jgi:hypothetical protein
LFDVMPALSSGAGWGSKERRPWFYQARNLLNLIVEEDCRMEPGD